MRTLIRPSVALLALVAFAAVVPTGCDTVRPATLTVNGNDTSQSSVDSELSAIADNPGLQQRISSTSGTIKSGASAIWLTQLVTQQVVDREVRRRHLKVTAADRRAGQTEAVNFFGDAQLFARFPKWFRDGVSARFARQQVLFRAIGSPPTDADVRAAYDSTVAQIKAQCPSGRFVSHILVPTREQADALAGQLAAGASFEQLARQQSTDPGSAPDGGELGCADGQQFVEPFATAASSLPLNQVSAPVQTQAGWHLIVVRDTIPFEILEAPLRQRLEQQSPDAQRKLGRLVAKAKVDVDPRYGRWVVRGGRGSVQPPRGTPPLTPATTGPTGGAPTTGP